MFDKLKQLNELRKMRSSAMALQKELEKITETVEKNGWIVSVTGDQKIRYIKKTSEDAGEDLEKLAEVINEAMKNVQKESAKKMMEMGGGLTGLLGKL
ncbi:hypothetical protein A2210_01310 [Candidatus Woesebacteria bacterium RIFOXYA1_FULL_40_18]|uniref:Nucleoid-associated protein n=4 Tax=Candidatus Woeseibacteriota TaxID=1752722 RepID=A0A1F8CLG9_9BACT|nr:MAG: hypothetical protein UT72_C0004G0002 [Candidatus Woesebacteria bacterium GW2011_GWB1_40_101]OGM77101.1 MAG: hypothetical protein A2210_01310 [Candidatus Woesebacteria bacterium RIFOXYA1_FULL_40_18]OGM81216.1 MAG: hypothetical protein A2361_02620 [Candidatus Woesebacteria bacterium RIFOXYB1_FULL_40_26]OGM87690.1 MAG: hypothetical protein A2614_00345 [Candidatus Woesebacteria bacterium RIFOXYD1_FULL_40_21]